MTRKEKFLYVLLVLFIASVFVMAGGIIVQYLLAEFGVSFGLFKSTEIFASIYLIYYLVVGVKELVDLV